MLEMKRCFWLLCKLAALYLRDCLLFSDWAGDIFYSDKLYPVQDLSVLAIFSFHLFLFLYKKSEK